MKQLTSIILIVLLNTLPVLAKEPIFKFKLSPKEIVNETYYWNNHIVVITNKTAEKQIRIICFTTNGDVLWTDEFPYKSSQESEVSLTVDFRKESLYVWYSRTLFTYNLEGKIRQLNFEPNNRYLGHELWFVTKQDKFESITIEYGRDKNRYWKNIINDNVKVEDRVQLNLSELKEGRWSFGAKIKDRYYFYGMDREFSKDVTTLNCYIQVVDLDGSLIQSMVYPIVSEKKGILSRSFMQFSEKDNAFYVFGFMGTNSRFYSGVFLHKISLEGKVLFARHYNY